MRIVNAAAAQMGPIQKAESREAVIKRMLALLAEAKDKGADVVVYPELALTTFFPRYYMTDPNEVNAWFESEMPNAAVQPLFDAAAAANIALSIGYAELTEDGHHFNTQILTDRSGRIVGKYRKVHLPGHAEDEPWRAFQHLEKRYFEVGNLGFPVFRAFGGVFGMCICNDRRWPETYRVMGLQGVEAVLLGYNTPIGHTLYPDVDGLSHFHNHLSMQAGAYQNATWVIGVAKCGLEEGSLMIGQSAIIAPSGEIVAAARTLEDEVIVSTCDLDFGRRYKETIFNFAQHREPRHYGLIVERKGAIPPS